MEPIGKLCQSSCDGLRERLIWAHSTKPRSRSSRGARLLAFQVALDEVLTNIIDYAHPEHPVSLIAIHVSTPPGGLEITIEDNGIAFNPLESDADPDLEQSLEERPIGGLGIHLVKSLMDTLEYRRQNNRNRLTLSKSLPDHGQ